MKGKYIGNLYNMDLKTAINDFRKKHGEPVAIYCNPGEFEETDLYRIETMQWPKNHFVLTDRVKQRE